MAQNNNQMATPIEQINITTDQAALTPAPVVGVDTSDVLATAQAQNVIPLNYSTALNSYTEAERQEIIALSEKINPREIEKVMNYGALPLVMTFDQCGKFLKDERGSHADQEVIKQVIELSKKATESYDDFQLVLREPNLFQKIFLALTSLGKNNGSQAEKIQNSAVTNYKLLGELKTSCDNWLAMLKKSMGDIYEAADNDMTAIQLLEKYLIAGHLAKARIEGEIADAQVKQQETGLQIYSKDFEQLTEGFNVFQITLNNLEKSRVAYYLSIGQLGLIRRSNTNVQISIHTQMKNSMQLISQQLRNAILDAKNREVLEGQKALTRLNDELIKDISQKIGRTAEETEVLIYSSFYHTDAAKEAITTVISSCDTIKKTAGEMLPKMKADMDQLNELIQQLEPCVGTATEALKIEGKSTVAPSGAVGLTF